MSEQLGAEAAAAVRSIERDGYAIFEDCLDAAYVERLRAAFTERLDRKRRDFAYVPNHVDRWSMHVPSADPFLDTRLIANPKVAPVLRAMLGEDAVLSVMASVSSDPGVVRQQPHQDSRFWVLSVTVVLGDLTVEAGPTELWPRTHRPNPEDPDGPFTRERVVWSRERLEAWVEAHPPEAPVLKAGSMLVRDARMIHCGGANRSSELRPILTFLYEPPPVAPPHRSFVNAAAWAALTLRRAARARGAGDSAEKWAGYGGALGTLIDRQAGSDRDYRRRIPADAWQRLSGDAQQLLRYAEVEGGLGQSGSWTGTYSFARRILQTAWTQMPLGKREG